MGEFDLQLEEHGKELDLLIEKYNGKENCNPKVRFLSEEDQRFYEEWEKAVKFFKEYLKKHPKLEKSRYEYIFPYKERKQIKGMKCYTNVVTIVANKI